MQLLAWVEKNLNGIQKEEYLERYIAEKVYAAGDVNGYASFATIYEEGKKVGIASAKIALRSNSELYLSYASN